MKPVRCFSCGKPLGGKYEEFDRRVIQGEKPGDIFEDIGVERYCCRRMLLTSTDFTEDIMKFQR